ncbi:FRG domain-containing protein [Priestia aryabhattai]|uniref:FRG domain-containing protein n=1 Tax=Priestia aryabhattai TaxID=412384 RepID=UPI001C8DE602|nr:FRG domain-containing protein [Priestia aryabhattai]MBY0008805.1 FRG domain-containing protein [Priestia aryabhattai]MBY0049987.1 FRG domain-containing protein [Priestia aryabhattai]
MWKEIKIENWNHFNDVIFTLNPKEWIFRGQCSVEWEIETSLYRECKKFLNNFNNENCIKVEKNMYEEFCSSYKLYSPTSIEKAPIESTETEWMKERNGILAMMQHYGTPTRFLDWTFSPYVATFFALDGANSDFCIYALKSKSLEEANIVMIGRNNAAERHKHSAFRKDYKKTPFLYSCEPFEKHERIRRQQGLFLVPSVIDKTINEILLESYGIEDGKLGTEEIAYKLIFSKDHLQEWWARLKHMGITHETIYPGLDGFCKSLKLSIINN